VEAALSVKKWFKPRAGYFAIQIIDKLKAFRLTGLSIAGKWIAKNEVAGAPDPNIIVANGTVTKAALQESLKPHVLEARAALQRNVAMRNPNAMVSQSEPEVNHMSLLTRTLSNNDIPKRLKEDDQL